MLRGICCFIMILTLTPAAVAGAQAISADELRQALKEHPEVLMEWLRQNQVEVFEIVKQGAAEARKRQWKAQVLKALDNPVSPVVQEDRPFKGPGDAAFTIVEYSDFMCSACRQGTRNVGILAQKHPKDVRVLMKHYPGDELGKQLAVYFEAIGRQDPDKAWRFANMVFAQQGKVRKEKLAAVQEIVGQLKLDQARLAKDLADPDLDKLVEEDLAEAKKLELRSTPSFVVNGVPIAGAVPVSALEEVMKLWQDRQDKKAKGE